MAGSLQTGDSRVRPRLGLRHGTPLASRDVPGERGRLSSCIWNLGFFANDARKNCPFVLTSFTGWSSERCPGVGFLSRGDREIGISGNFVGRIKGAKCPFDLQFLTWGFS